VLEYMYCKTTRGHIMMRARGEVGWGWSTMMSHQGCNSWSLIPGIDPQMVQI
jgi:hypothetical protein